MPCFLHGEWRAFSNTNRNVTLHGYKVYITHNTKNIIAVQEDGSSCSPSWTNMGMSNNVGYVGSTFDISWEDRCDSKGAGLLCSHSYKLKIVDKDLIVQVQNSGESYSFGNWVRSLPGETVEQTKKRILKSVEKNTLGDETECSETKDS